MGGFGGGGEGLGSSPETMAVSARSSESSGSHESTEGKEVFDAGLRSESLAEDFATDARTVTGSTATEYSEASTNSSQDTKRGEDEGSGSEQPPVDRELFRSGLDNVAEQVLEDPEPYVPTSEGSGQVELSATNDRSGPQDTDPEPPPIETQYPEGVAEQVSKDPEADVPTSEGSEQVELGSVNDGSGSGDTDPEPPPVEAEYPEGAAEQVSEDPAPNVPTSERSGQLALDSGPTMARDQETQIQNHLRSRRSTRKV
jgi:hypothetical protein